MLLDDIGKYIEEEGELGTQAFTLFLGTLPPDAPASCIAVYEYAGMGPIRTSSGVIAERPRIQVMVRHEDYEEARTKIEQLQNLLDGVCDVTINSTRYIWIEALEPPFRLGKDQKEREQLVCNFQVIKERTTLT